jgi:hypothetical protein
MIKDTMERGTPSSTTPESRLFTVIDPLKDLDAFLLLRHIKMLKQSDGEGWAIGEVVERALDYFVEQSIHDSTTD